MKLFSKLKFSGSLAAAILLTQSVRGQTEASVTNYITPSFRNAAGSESAFWNESFTNAYGGANQAAVAAPGGLVLANASVAQTAQGAFIIGGPGGGDIYSFGSTNTFILNYAVSRPTNYANGIGGVVFQTETAGTELDYSSVVLSFNTCSGAQTLVAARNEAYRNTGDSGFGPSSDVVSEWQWPALPAGVTSFSIIFNGAGTSVDFERAMLDVTPALVSAGSFSLEAAPANIQRWMYAFNAKPANRTTASTFGALGSLGQFDSRDGQYLVGWNTSNNVPTGQGAKNYLLSRMRVTLTLSSDLAYVYDGTLHDYRSYFPSSDPRHLTRSATYPVELYGAGFRGGFTNASGAFTPYTALNYPQAGPFGASATGGGPYGAYSNRVAFSACFDTNGLLVDVSNNVGDDGTNEMANPFEVAPFAIGNTTNVAPGQAMPEGSQLTFDLNLADPLIYAYVQQGLNSGNLSFVVSSLLDANFFSGTPNYPDFYTVFNSLAGINECPLLTVEGTTVRPCLDADNDGLPDDWEQFYFGGLGAGATNIIGADHLNNLSKYVAGVNPSNTATDLQVSSVSNKQNVTELHFIHAPSRQYNIQWSVDLKNWQTVTNPVLGYSSAWLAKAGTNQVYPSPVYAVWRDTNTSGGQRFYRIATH
jgi:hypothetical protein